MKRWQPYIIFAWFHLGWLGCVLLAKTQHAWTAFGFSVLLAFYFFKNNDLSKNELLVTVCAALVGIAFDSVMNAAGLIRTVPETSGLIPVWLVALWFLFALVIVKNRAVLSFAHWIAALLGAVFGPLSYKSGEFFEVLFMNSVFAITLYAIFWAAYFPLILFGSRRLL